MTDELVLTAGGARAVVFPDDGGRLGRLEVDGRPLLRGPEQTDKGWAYWGCYPLVPWSNRIPGGVARFEGREMRVPVNWPDGTAVHGLAAWVPWSVVDADGAGAELVVDLDEDGYRVQGTQRFRVSETHLDLELGVANRGDARVPVGLGIHPWFVAGEVRVPADRHWPEVGALPVGLPEPVGPDEDLRVARVPPPMDRCYTALTGTSVDVPGLALSWHGPVTQVVVYSGEPGWVCVEPVTMANDGFRLYDEGVGGTGVLALDPGAAVSVEYRFGWADAADADGGG